MDVLIVGAGYAGAVCARLLAEQGHTITVIERRPHIAGNMYDELDSHGVLVHRYGPHISVMNEKEVFDFLSRFTEWQPYHHNVLAEIDGKQVPLPINFTSIDLLYQTEEAIELKNLLIAEYGLSTTVPILELRKSNSTKIRQFAEFIYEKVFVHYTTKMWGISPEEIDPAVTARIPIRLSYDNRHFLHTYQVMPRAGFTALFEKMLDHPSIHVSLSVDATTVLKFDERQKMVYFNNRQWSGIVIYTGALDELFEFRFGELPYRSLHFEFTQHQVRTVQDCTVLNWPDARPATRRTEMTRLTQQPLTEDKTSTIIEYPGAFVRRASKFNEPYYPVSTPANLQMYSRYRTLIEEFRNVYAVGRLAEYRYYNMEATILAAFKLIRQLS